MLRCAQKFPRLLYFMKADDTPYLHSIHPGWSASQLERVTWNTEKRAIAAKITRPLLHAAQPDEWSRMRRASIAADSWLTDEYATDEYDWLYADS